MLLRNDTDKKRRKRIKNNRIEGFEKNPRFKLGMVDLPFEEEGPICHYIWSANLYIYKLIVP